MTYLLAKPPPRPTSRAKNPIMILYLNTNNLSKVAVREHVNYHYQFLEKKFNAVYNILVYPVSDQNTELVIMSSDTKIDPIKVEDNLVIQLEKLINEA